MIAAYIGRRRLTNGSTGAREASFLTFFQFCVARPVNRSVRPTREDREGLNAADAEAKKKRARDTRLKRGAV